MGKSQRDKGKAGEREAAARLNDLLGTMVQRELGQERDGGCDIVCGPIDIQVKRQEQQRIYDWIAQAEDDCRDGQLPAVMWRTNKRDWLVAMPFEAWCQLVREAADMKTPEPVVYWPPRKDLPKR